MIRARTLRPLRNGSATLTAKPPPVRLRFFFPEVFLEQLAGSLHTLHDTATDLALLSGSKFEPIACSRSIAVQSSPSMLSPQLGLLRPSSGSQGERCQQHHIDFVLVLFHRVPGSKFRVSATLHKSDNYRTDTEQGPHKHRTPRALVSAALIPLSRATLDGSTRLRAERSTAPGGNPLVPVLPQLLCFLW